MEKREDTTLAHLRFLCDNVSGTAKSGRRGIQAFKVRVQPHSAHDLKSSWPDIRVTLSSGSWFFGWLKRILDTGPENANFEEDLFGGLTLKDALYREEGEKRRWIDKSRISRSGKPGKRAGTEFRIVEIAFGLANSGKGALFHDRCVRTITVCLRGEIADFAILSLSLAEWASGDLTRAIYGFNSSIQRKDKVG